MSATTETYSFPEGMTVRERVVGILAIELKSACSSAAFYHPLMRDIAISIVETLGELGRTTSEDYSR